MARQRREHCIDVAQRAQAERGVAQFWGLEKRGVQGGHGVEKTFIIGHAKGRIGDEGRVNVLHEDGLAFSVQRASDDGVPNFRRQAIEKAMLPQRDRPAEPVIGGAHQPVAGRQDAL